MGLGGPVGFVRLWLEKFAVWIALGTGIWLAWHLATSADLVALWRRPGDGSLPFWVAVDLVIALPISWLPLVADYNRFARRASRAFWGTALGFFVTSLWFLVMGATLMLESGVSQEPKDFATGIALIAGWGALLILLADETHNAWADLYSSALSLQNIAPKAKQRWLIAALGLGCFLVAANLDVTQYQGFLFLIGSFFIPLFGVLAADYFVLRGRRYELEDIYSGGEGGKARRNFNGRGIAVWLVGVLVYHLTNPGTLASFIPGWQSLVPRSLTAIGGSIPSFVVPFALYAAWGRISRRPGRSARPKGRQS